MSEVLASTAGEIEPGHSEAGKSMLDKIAPLSKLKGARNFIETIDSLSGRKCLILRNELRGLINKLINRGEDELRKSGVDCVLELSSTMTAGFDGSIAPDKIIFIVRPSISLMKDVARFIQEYAAGETLQDVYHVYFVPHSTVACEQVLEDEGVLDQCEIGEIDLGFAPLNSDLLSLGMPNVFRECYVDGDASSLSIVASALHRLQSQLGLIPHIKTKGAASRKVVQKMLHLRRNEMTKKMREGSMEPSTSSSSFFTGTLNNAHNPSSTGSEIDTLFVLDREVDLVSPLLSPLTYEGLVDDLLGIQNGSVLVNEAIIGEKDNKGDDKPIGSDNDGNNATTKKCADAAGILEDSPPEGLLKVVVDDSDPIFSEIRNLSIQRLGPYLQEKAVENKQRHAAFRENKDASISELHDFVKKMPALTKEYKSLTQHIHIAELIKTTTDSREFREQWQGERGMLEGESFMDTIEKLVVADAEATSLLKILRLLCIQSTTAGGIRSTRFDTIKKLIVQTYGYEHMFTVINLERAGLLKRKDLVLVETAQPVWQNLRKQLKLIDEREESMLGLEHDMSYVSAGYAPMTARLVQNVVTMRPAGLSQPSWRSVADIVRLMPGPTLEFMQTSAPEELDEALQRSAAAQKASASSRQTDEAKFDQTLFQLSLGEGEQSQKKVMLVVIVGGISFLEIAAFRVLSNDPAFPFRIILASTTICNGDVFLQSLRGV